MKRGSSHSRRDDSPEAATPPPKHKAGAGHWSMRLLASMENPEMVVESDELIVTIRDAYPKAKHHYLILSRENIQSLKEVTSSHLDLLKHMLRKGKKLADRLQCENPSLRFRCGYHAVPSMMRLHMHVISQDFDSPCLKNKKHWNSFTSEFFVDADEIITMLETKGKVSLNSARYELLLKQALRCHVCHAELPNMPKLKAHIVKHV